MRRGDSNGGLLWLLILGALAALGSLAAIVWCVIR